MLRSSDAAFISMLALAGCAELPPDYLVLPPESAAERELQSRRFDSVEEKDLLLASVGVLQDLGFAMETKGSALGFVQGTKEREAKAPEQKLVLMVLLALAASQGHSGGNMPVDQIREDQTISVLLSVRPATAGDAKGRPHSHLVRVTFHSHLRQPLGPTAGALHDPDLYRSFFELLSRALFLEAHKL
jgi:hypothetical protein